MYTRDLSILKAMVGSAVTKNDGFFCERYFRSKIASEPDFIADCRVRTDARLCQQLTNAADALLGGSGSVDVDMLCIDNAFFCHCATALRQQSGVLLYFSDLLKGQVYVKTGPRTFGIYYFSFRKSWIGA